MATVEPTEAVEVAAPPEPREPNVLTDAGREAIRNGASRREEGIACPEPGCDYVAHRPQDLGRHRKTVHGVQSRNDQRRAKGQAPSNSQARTRERDAARKREERARAKAKSPAAAAETGKRIEIGGKVETGNGILRDVGLEEIRSETQALVEAMGVRIARIDERLAIVDAEAAALREARKEAASIRDKLTPKEETAAAPKRQAKRKSKSRKEITEADLGKVERVSAYLLEHRAELADGFTAADLHRRLPADGKPISADKVRGIVEVLRDRGQLRLDRVVRGGGHAYKLVGD